jgi:hypothetical protein
MSASYGERFAEYVADYLSENDLTNTDGRPSLGKIDGRTLAALADKFDALDRRRDKAERSKRLSQSELEVLFDALARGTGCDPKAMTEAELRRCAVARAAIVRATPDVTAAEIEAACKKYAAVFNGAVITPTAISNNWSKLIEPGRGAKKAAGPSNWSAQPRFDWHRVVGLLWPRERYPDRGPWEEDSWDLVPSQIKQRIHAEGEAVLEKVLR